MRARIERPIEGLAPRLVRALLGQGGGLLLLPMAPQPVLDEGHVRVLVAELVKIGCPPARTSAESVLDAAWREGLLSGLRCPYGHGGDVLWVREAWASTGRHYRYCGRDDAPAEGDPVWFPAQRMPREAARLVLKIEDVGIVQLDDSWRWHLEVTAQ